MKPARFDYARAGSAEEAFSLLHEYGEEAVALAGGQSLLAMMNMRLADPAVVVDLSDCTELDFARVAGDRVEIGAMFRQAALERWHGTQTHLPLLSSMLPYIGHYQTRARGTVGGSMAHADPSAEIPLAAVTMGAEVVLRSVRGERRVAARDFFLGPLDTERDPDELIWSVSFPSYDNWAGMAFEEVAYRHGDFAIAAFAAVADADTVVLGVGGVAGRPTVFEWPRAALEDIDAELAVAARELEVLSDHHADDHYRRRLLRSVAPNVLARAVSAASSRGSES